MSERRKYIAFFVLLVLFILGFNIQKFLEKNELEELGTVYSVASIKSKNNRTSLYYFDLIYNQKTYTVSSTGVGVWLRFEDKIKIGDNVYVILPKSKPEKADFFLNFTVPKNLPSPPPDGWTLEELQEIDPNFKPERYIE